MITDPVVAVGFRYKVGAGNPNFAAVRLPANIGDRLYRMVLESGKEFDVRGGEAFRFGGGGMSSFTVLGIDESAGMLPNHPTGFVIGVSFVGLGALPGTMQALLVLEVPTWALWAAGLAVLAGAARGRAV